MSLTDERIIEIVSTGGAVQCREVLREPLRFGAISYRFFTSGLLEFARAIERESALKWTDALPTAPGKYWWRVSRNLNSPILMNVQQDIYSQFRIGGGAGTTVNSQGGQWAGPIPEPEGPSA